MKPKMNGLKIIYLPVLKKLDISATNIINFLLLKYLNLETLVIGKSSDVISIGNVKNEVVLWGIQYLKQCEIIKTKILTMNYVDEIENCFIVHSNLHELNLSHCKFSNNKLICKYIDKIKLGFCLKLRIDIVEGNYGNLSAIGCDEILDTNYINNN
jgi:hypothetical protein